tara:strand:+ start:4159 stop:4527 length:369 start_codon:yes stop_codon:yes gene_type:complete
MRYKNRKDKLIDRVKNEISSKTPNYGHIGEIIDDYERTNLNIIRKLKVKRRFLVNKVNGALKQTINAHGPITKNLIGSASKRIMGSLEDSDSKEKSKFELISFILGAISCFVLLFSLYLWYK